MPNRIEEFRQLTEDIKNLMSSTDWKENVKEYSRIRKGLADIANDVSQEAKLRLDSSVASDGLKRVMHQSVGAMSSADHPSLKLYDQNCLTTTCRVK